MSGFQKLKSRTELQAFLLSFLVLFLDHFLGLDIDVHTLWQMVGLSGAYGASRGLAKMRHGDHHPGQVAAKTILPTNSTEDEDEDEVDDEGSPEDTTLVTPVLPPPLETKN